MAGKEARGISLVVAFITLAQTSLLQEDGRNGQTGFTFLQCKAALFLRHHNKRELRCTIPFVGDGRSHT